MRPGGTVSLDEAGVCERVAAGVSMRTRATCAHTRENPREVTAWEPDYGYGRENGAAMRANPGEHRALLRSRAGGVTPGCDAFLFGDDRRPAWPWHAGGLLRTLSRLDHTPGFSRAAGQTEALPCSCALRCGSGCCPWAVDPECTGALPWQARIDRDVDLVSHARAWARNET